MAFVNTDVVLTNAAQTVMGAGTNGVLIFKASVTNTDASARSVTFYRVPMGGSPSLSNVVIDGETIAAGGTIVLPLSGQSLVNGQTLQGLASVTSVVNVAVSGLAA